MIGAFRQKAVEKYLIQPLRRENRFRHALGRILIEIDIGCAISQIHVGENGFRRKQGRDAEGAIMCDRRGPHPTFGADEGDVAAKRLRFGVDEDRGDRSQKIGHVDRGDQIFGNTVADEVAIQCYVIVAADNDDTGGGIANLRERSKVIQQRSRRACRLKNDEIWRRRGREHRGRSVDVTLRHPQCYLAHAPVTGQCVHDALHVVADAEGVDGDAGQGPQAVHIGGAHRLQGVCSVA